jgi:hypothetical protein
LAQAAQKHLPQRPCSLLRQCYNTRNYLKALS